MVKELLAAGASKDRGTDGRRPLHIASQKNHLEALSSRFDSIAQIFIEELELSVSPVVRSLLQLDADVDAPGPHGMSAAFFACSRGCLPVDARDMRQQTPLHLAARFGYEVSPGR
eukprot:Skav212346  [mRNA]  locus=scaffold1488:286734:289646:+ [translate_table: standard]